MDAAHHPLHERRGVTESVSGLTAFQVELAQVFFSLSESAGFLLAGGGALIAQGIVPRPTDDLDFFTARGAGDVAAASDALTRAYQERNWSVEVIREAPEFRRMEITGPDTVLVDPRNRLPRYRGSPCDDCRANAVVARPRSTEGACAFR